MHNNSSVWLLFCFVLFQQVSGDTATGCLLFLEIQEGKVPMRKKKFMPEAGPTAGTSLRLVEGSEYTGQAVLERVEAQNQGSMRSLVCADSWFGSVKLVESLKCMYREPRAPTARDPRTYALCVDKERGNNPLSPECICSIKSNTSCFPHAQLKKEMKNFPSGAYLVMECMAPGTNVNLVAIAYKYNSKKTLLFAMSRDAETTEPGLPYVARYANEHGNVRERRVLRPRCLSIYFRAANLIDMHNHLRQGVLRLEMHWKTPNPWFRLISTIIGTTVVDCFLATKFHLGAQQKPVSGGVEHFADCLAWDLTHNQFNNNVNTRGQVHPNIAASNVVDGASQQQPMSLTEQATQYAKRMIEEALIAQFGASTVGGAAGLRSCPPISVVDLESTEHPIVSPSESLSVLEVDAASSLPSQCLPCNSGVPSVPPTHVHQPIRNPDTSVDADSKARPCARRCAICNMKTRFICGHPACLAKRKTRKIPGTEELKILRGVGICNGNRIREGMERPCVEEHRIQMEILRMQQQTTE